MLIALWLDRPQLSPYFSFVSGFCTGVESVCPSRKIAESFAWLAVFAIAPISAIYYPVSVLPDWLQTIAWTMPPVYVFEGMREVLFNSEFHAKLLMQAMALNLFYLVLGLTIFLYSFRVARQRGLLLQIGE